MAYQKQTFIDMETIATAEQMNHIEDGIVQNESDISANTADIKANKNNITTLTSDLATQEKTVQQNTSDIQQNTSDIQQNTSDISELNSALAELIFVQRIQVPSVTVGANSDSGNDVTIEVPNGYALAGIVGYELTSNYCFSRRINTLADSTTGIYNRIYYVVRNTSSSSVTITPTFDFLFVKTSMIKREGLS